jgi:RNA recognition motif-containing protein
MDKKLYVGNLSYNTTDQDLRALFEQAGVVETVELIKDRETGRSKGFAFVEMATQSDAEKAISMFNGTSLDNRQIKVNIARPREEKPRSSGYGGGGYGSSGGYGNRRQGNQNRNKSGGTRRY